GLGEDGRVLGGRVGDRLRGGVQLDAERFPVRPLRLRGRDARPRAVALERALLRLAVLHLPLLPRLRARHLPLRAARVRAGRLPGGRHARHPHLVARARDRRLPHHAHGPGHRSPHGAGRALVPGAHLLLPRVRHPLRLPAQQLRRLVPGGGGEHRGLPGPRAPHELVHGRRAARLTGREVTDTAQKKNGFSTWHDRVLETTMQSYTTTLQRTRDASVTEQTDPRGEHRTFMEFTGPADVTGTLFLHLSPRGEKDQQWVYTPTARKARRLADAARDENFMGTDLSYRDLELIVRIQQWNDSEATATLEPEAPLDGKPCQVVALATKNDELPYSRYRLWFGSGDFLLWKVDV